MGRGGVVAVGSFDASRRVSPRLAPASTFQRILVFASQPCS